MIARVETLIRDAYAAAVAQGKARILVALDGRCAAGKTTLAASLAEALADIGCMVLHMDDFFLPPSRRTPERLATPGGNVDHERFLEEILRPIADGRHFWYVPYSCRVGRMVTPVALTPAPIVLVEGAYASHPALRDFYDLRLFLSVDPATQMARIRARNGDEAAEVFRTRWIPLEEAYIAACAPDNGAICLS